MAEPTSTAPTALEAHIARLAAGLASALDAAAAGAARGQVLADCEALLLGQGRQFLRDCLSAALDREAAEADKKGARPGPVPADTPPAVTRGPLRARSSPPSALSA